jgi:hypothetical protein
MNDNNTEPPQIPTGLFVYNITNTGATFSWTPDNSAVSYHLRYKRTTETTWTVASINVPSITVTGLAANTSYDYACETVGSAGPSGYSATQTFTTGTVLPVNGIEIMARRQGANVIVSWTTQSEQNSAYFNVERSYDGIVFTTIGRVQAAGFSNNLSSYQFTDMNAAKSIIFYRLKLVDADAGYKLSPVRVVAKSDGVIRQFLLYPNPATNNITIVLNQAAKEDMQLQIINSMGQIVKNARIEFGTQVSGLNVSELPKGIYVLKLTGSDGVQSLKLVIM